MTTLFSFRLCNFPAYLFLCPIDYLRTHSTIPTRRSSPSSHKALHDDLLVITAWTTTMTFSTVLLLSFLHFFLASWSIKQPFVWQCFCNAYNIPVAHTYPCLEFIYLAYPGLLQLNKCNLIKPFSLTHYHAFVLICLTTTLDSIPFQSLKPSVVALANLSTSVGCKPLPRVQVTAAPEDIPKV